MFRLNRLTDYGVVVLMQMAQAPERLVSATQLAEESGVPAPTVAKLLNGLARSGLIDSTRGAAGGYRLAAPAGEISIAAIIQALEGPIALTACVEGAHDSCESELICPMRGNWEKVNGAIRQALAGVTLADMTFGFPASPVRSVGEPPAPDPGVLDTAPALEPAR